MGAFSNLGEFSDAQEISADDTESTNKVDLAVTTPQLGVGEPVYLCIRTNTAPTEANDTLSIEVQVDDNASFTSPKIVLMPLVGANGAEVAASDARLSTAGAWIYRGALPYGINERYMQLMYRNTTSSGTFTIDAWLSQTPPQSDFDKQVFVSPVGNP